MEDNIFFYDDDDYYDEDYNDSNCPMCGREYEDEASYDFQICDYCGWSVSDSKYVW